MVLSPAEHPGPRVDARRLRPQPSSASRSALSASVLRSMPTPDASATCRRSPIRPSETSIIAAAPASAATRPCPYGGCGTRWRCRKSSNRSIPLCHSAYPAAECPSWPATAIGEPGRAPDRSTGGAAGQIAQHGHRHHPLRAADQISADDAGANPAGLVPHPVGQRADLCGRRVRRCAEADDERGDPCRPSLRCRRRSARRLYGRHRAVSTSPAESACPRPACPSTPRTRPSAASTTAASSPGPRATRPAGADPESAGRSRRIRRRRPACDRSRRCPHHLLEIARSANNGRFLSADFGSVSGSERGEAMADSEGPAAGGADRRTGAGDRRRRRHSGDRGDPPPAAHRWPSPPSPRPMRTIPRAGRCWTRCHSDSATISAPRIVQPAPAGTAAWRAASDSEPVVLRCGLDRPADFVVGSPIQQVDRVQWFEVRQDRAIHLVRGRSSRSMSRSRCHRDPARRRSSSSPS